MKKAKNEVQVFPFALEEHALPTLDEVAQHALDKGRKLYLEDEIDVSTLAIGRRILLWNIEDEGKEAKDRAPIYLYIHCYGGDLDYMWGLIDIIEASQTPVYTIAVGKCASAAALIFIAGHRRFMLPRAHVVIHEGSASMSGDAVKVLDASDSYRKELKAMRKYVETHTRIPPKELNKKRNNDWEIDASYCLENGVCDVIASSLKEII